MPQYIAVSTLVLMLAIVVVRVRLMKRQGIDAFQFGKIDKKDFLIPPFVLFYFYTVFANALNLPLVSTQKIFHSEVMAWTGVVLCFAGLCLFFWSVVSFGRSFRVGIDTDYPNQLVTTGAFAHSRNPIYVAFAIILLGQFLIFSNWILLLYLGAAAWLFHRQVLREEDFLKQQYGKEFIEYCERVRRYI